MQKHPLGCLYTNLTSRGGVWQDSRSALSCICMPHSNASAGLLPVATAGAQTKCLAVHAMQKTAWKLRTTGMLQRPERSPRRHRRLNHVALLLPRRASKDRLCAYQIAAIAAAVRAMAAATRARVANIQGHHQPRSHDLALDRQSSRQPDVEMQLGITWLCPHSFIHTYRPLS
jgi:hypothetical protein